MTGSIPLTPLEAAFLTRDCLCSDCWAHLIEHFDGRTRTATVRCPTEGCPCSGYVSKGFVERRRAESVGERIEAIDALKESVSWLKPVQKKTEAELLKELGF